MYERDSTGSSPMDIFQQRSRLNNILASISDNLFSYDIGMWSWDSMTDTFYLNAPCMKLAGLATQSTINRKEFWKKLVHPEDRNVFRRHIIGPAASTDEKGEQFEFFYRMLTPSGDYKWILSKGCVLSRDEKRRATRMAGLAIDVQTLSDQNERRITQHERTAYAVEATQGGLWDWNPENNKVYYSERYIAMLGYTPEQLPQTFEAWVLLVHKDDLEVILRPQYACISSPEYGDSFEVVYRILAADNTYRWILSRGKVIYRDENGRAKRLVGLHIDVTDLRAAQEALTAIVNHDQLTRLGSRFAFDAALTELDEKHLPVSLIYMDVDGLKLINDTLSHTVGDSLLTKAADLLRGAFRPKDMVARIGGDEFVVLLPSCPEDDAKRMLNNIRQICAEYNSSGAVMPVLISMGMACTEQGVTVEQLIETADRAMILDKIANAAINHERLKVWLERHSGKSLASYNIRSRHYSYSR